MKLIVLSLLFSYVAQNAIAMRGRAFSRDVPRVLVEVEQKWLDWSLASVQCDGLITNATDCLTSAANATAEFTKSCSTVSLAIIKTSAGDKARMQTYMTDVCGADLLKGQLEELCLDFSQVLVQEMSEYQHENLEGRMNTSKVCLDLLHEGYLGRYAEKESQRLRDERAAKAEEEQRKAEEAAIEQAQKEADSKAALARKRLDEMANATATVTAKREEAVAAAVEAQRKAEQVEEAEQIQKRLQVEAKEAAAAAQAVKDKIQKRLASKTANGTQQSESTADAPVTEAASVNKTFRTAKSFLATFPFTYS